jgi:hypothetical protein
MEAVRGLCSPKSALPSSTGTPKSHPPLTIPPIRAPPPKRWRFGDQLSCAQVARRGSPSCRLPHYRITTTAKTVGPPGQDYAKGLLLFVASQRRDAEACAGQVTSRVGLGPGAALARDCRRATERASSGLERRRAKFTARGLYIALDRHSGWLIYPPIYPRPLFRTFYFLRPVTSAPAMPCSDRPENPSRW